MDALGFCFEVLGGDEEEVVGAEAGASIVGATLPQSAEVTVLERIIIGDTAWVRIESIEKPTVSGRILAEETVSFEPP